MLCPQLDNLGFAGGSGLVPDLLVFPLLLVHQRVGAYHLGTPHSVACLPLEIDSNLTYHGLPGQL